MPPLSCKLWLNLLHSLSKFVIVTGVEITTKLLFWWIPKSTSQINSILELLPPKTILGAHVRGIKGNVSNEIILEWWIILKAEIEGLTSQQGGEWLWRRQEIRSSICFSQLIYSAHECTTHTGWKIFSWHCSRGLLAAGGQRPGMPLNHLQCTGQSPYNIELSISKG